MKSFRELVAEATRFDKMSQAEFNAEIKMDQEKNRKTGNRPNKVKQKFNRLNRK